MTTTQINADAGTLDRDFAVAWYRSWVEAWNDHDFDGVQDIITGDFVLDSPTTRHTNWHVQGRAATADYLRYVLTAYPDLKWEVIAPPMFDDAVQKAAFSWRGTGHFTGRLTPPGLDGTGKAFDFSGLEVFSFRGTQACHLWASYDLIGLMKQIGLYASAGAGAPR